MPSGAGLIGGALGALGSSGGSQSTTQRAPRWAQPALRGALADATGLYNQGLNADQLAGMNLIRGAAQDNSFLSGAQNAVSGMLAAGPNPYLDQMFNQAADATRSRFKSEFAMGGRDTAAAAPFREAELTNLATNIYGGAYDADQNRRLSAAGMVPGLNAASYQGGQALMGIGAVPGQQLDQYIGRIGGIVGNQGTTSTPMSGNPALGFLGGYNLMGGG